MNDTTSLRVSVEDGALTIAARGVVTKETMHLARVELLRAAYVVPLERVLFDFSKAVLLLTPNAWAEFVEHGLSDEFVPIPSALLVPETNIKEAWAFCDRLNEHGRAFVAFTSTPGAYHWLRGEPERRRAPRSAAESLSPEQLERLRRRVPEPRG